jgi:hypothetical protein
VNQNGSYGGTNSPHIAKYVELNPLRAKTHVINQYVDNSKMVSFLNLVGQVPGTYKVASGLRVQRVASNQQFANLN